MRPTTVVAALLLAAQAGLIGWAAWHTCPTLDEVAHLPAGIYVWEFGRFDVYRVNPPLVRSLAALPAVLGGARTDWGAYQFGTGLRPEWALGKQFIRANPGRWRSFHARGRCAVLPLTLLGGLTCWLWSSRLHGPSAGLLSLALWCSSPSLLGWGATITTDASAAALGVLACYAFWSWLEDPGAGRAVAAGVALGLAELAKMTWVVLFPLWPALWLATRRPPRATVAAGQLAQLGLILLLGLASLNLGYGFAGSFKTLDSYTFVSRPLAGPDSQADRGAGGNRFRGSWVGRLPVPVPEDYLLGLDLQRLDFDRGLCCYLNARWYSKGFLYYYVYAILLKEPVGTLALVGLAVWAALRRRSGPAPDGSGKLALLAPPVAVLVLVSSATSINQHFRYVLPVLPFAYVWAGKAVHLAERGSLSTATVWAALAWSAASSLATYPHSLSYFNELAGGPAGGHAYLVDSNVDWGQDLFDLKRWYDEHPRARPLHLAYFGAVDPAAAGIHALPVPGWPPCERGGADARAATGPQPGWHAISVNHLRGYRLHPGEIPSYEYFLRARPVAMAGYSIYIYHFDAVEANALRRALGLPELVRPPPEPPRSPRSREPASGQETLAACREAHPGATREDP